MGEEQVVLPDRIRGQGRGKPGLRQADAHRQADARQIVVQPAGDHAEGGQRRSMLHKAVPQCLGQPEPAARGSALRPGGTAQGQHQTAAAPEALRGTDLEARAIGQGHHVMHVGLAVEGTALTAAILHQGIQQTFGRDSQEQLAVGAFFHGQAPAMHQALHVLRSEGVQCGLAEGGIGAGIVMGRQTAVGEVGLAAAADAQLAAGGGGTFQQGHVQAVGRGFAGAHKARRTCPQDEDVRFPGSGV